MEVFCRTVPPTSCNLQFSHLISIISRFILISKFKLPLKQARKHSSRNRKPLSTSHLSMLVLFMEQSFNSPVKSCWLSEVVNPQCFAMTSSVQISTHILRVQDILQSLSSCKNSSSSLSFLIISREKFDQEIGFNNSSIIINSVCLCNGTWHSTLLHTFRFLPQATIPLKGIFLLWGVSEFSNIKF